jgi:hypothetical protein
LPAGIKPYGSDLFTGLMQLYKSSFIKAFYVL